MWKIPEKLYSRIRTHYDNRGGKGINSGHFEKLPIPIQKEIISLTGLNSGQEDILLASYLKNEYLVVITNEKIYWLPSDNIVKSIALENISSTDFSFVNSSPKNRPFVDCLKIKMENEERFLIKMEAGKTCSSMLNVLHLITNLRK